MVQFNSYEAIKAGESPLYKNKYRIILKDLP